MNLDAPPAAPQFPRPRFALGVTGHHEANPTFAANRARITAALEDVFDIIEAALGDGAANRNEALPTRLHTLLADGTDQIAARSAIRRGWELVAPLPFGRKLNTAINARPTTTNDARMLVAGGSASDPDTQGAPKP